MPKVNCSECGAEFYKATDAVPCPRCGKGGSAPKPPSLGTSPSRKGAERGAETEAKAILVSTTNEVFGRAISRHLGIARGGTVRAKNAVSDFGAGVKNLVGGEIVAYTKLMADAREQALHRMKVDAYLLGADAVVGVSFSTAMIDVGTAEITAFGTAVSLNQENDFGR